MTFIEFIVCLDLQPEIEMTKQTIIAAVTPNAFWSRFWFGFEVYGIRSLERGRHAYTAPHVIGEMLPVKLIGVQIHDCYWGLSCKWLHTYSRVYFSCITLRGENVVWIPCPCNDPFVISVIKMSSAVSLNYGAKFWGQHAAALTTLDQVKISYNILYFSIVILVV